MSQLNYKSGYQSFFWLESETEYGTVAKMSLKYVEMFSNASTSTKVPFVPFQFPSCVFFVAIDQPFNLPFEPVSTKKIKRQPIINFLLTKLK